MSKKHDALAVQDDAPTAIIARPDYLVGEDNNAGLENAALPRRPARLVLCQSTNPQGKKSNPDYIEDLEEGQLFNDTEGTIYGTGPVKFIIVAALPERWIEFFDPKVDGKSGVKDFSIPPGDARRDFRDDGKGNRIKPVATEFRDFLVLLPETNEILVLSLKGTQIKASEKLVKLAKSASAPVQSQIFQIETVPDRKDSYSFFNVKFTRAPEKFASADLYAYAKKAYQGYKDVTIDVTTDVPEGGEVVEGSSQPIDDTDIPF